jgi:hypothetical protein
VPLDQQRWNSSLAGGPLMAAFGLGCSLIPGARWQDGGRRQSRRFGDMADGFAV